MRDRQILAVILKNMANCALNSNLLIPIVSSESLGWKPLIVEEFQQPPGSMEIPKTDAGHLIALCLSSRPYRLHQVIGDRRYVGLYSKGDISIAPTDIPGSYCAEGEDHYLAVQIPAEFLKSLAQEIELDSDQIELVTEFQVRDRQLEQTLMLLRAELHQGGGSQLYVESLANVLAVNLLREYSSIQPRISVYQGGLSDRKILQISDYVQAHLDQEIKLANLATVAGMSQFHFSRMFKQSMGMTPHQYVLQQRVERAKQLLKGTKMSIAEIALHCGFNSQSHLGKAFRDAIGMTPSGYRKH
ncbi:helix-turn-helix domain-containing protein [Leptolyngbya sp. AN03gr2]|uniref:helix-turn-helix domain-containing protein n=1 Tax=unclassified Leptolyngbya TaxID=2650499 RepID=UPI003D312950